MVLEIVECGSMVGVVDFEFVKCKKGIFFMVKVYCFYEVEDYIEVEVFVVCVQRFFLGFIFVVIMVVNVFVKKGNQWVVVGMFEEVW